MKTRTTAMVSPEQWGACNPLSRTMLEDAGVKLIRNDKKRLLVEDEMNELQFVESYLPSMMSEEEVRSLVENIIAEVGASQMSDFSKVMPQVMKKGAGKVDGNLAQSIVKELLS